MSTQLNITTTRGENRKSCRITHATCTNSSTEFNNRWDQMAGFTSGLTLTHPETSSQPSAACRALDLTTTNTSKRLQNAAQQKHAQNNNECVALHTQTCTNSMQWHHANQLDVPIGVILGRQGRLHPNSHHSYPNCHQLAAPRQH